MIILGIETSCDDTGIALVETDRRRSKCGLKRIPAPEKVRYGVNFDILSNVVSSQIKVHAKFGGVVPNLAAREHLKNIESCLKQAFQEAKVKPKEIDLIAVTIGPGLIPSLLIGTNFAKTLAYVWKKPIIAVNHLEAHIIAAFSNENSKLKSLPRRQAGQNSKLFPAVALVVSGGHTQLVLVKKLGDYKIIGETRDDAAGECFDKVAKLLRLPYPGGPVIAAEAAKLKVKKSLPAGRQEKLKVNLPRPMIKHKNYDFSFSGLKTAVLYLLKDLMGDIGCPKIKNVGHPMSHIIPEICAEVQQAIIDVLIEKTLRAAKEYKAKTIILSGGVAANEELRKQFWDKIQDTRYKIQTTNFLMPAKNLCTDNAAMVAAAGYFRYKSGAKTDWRKIKADANLRIG